MNKLHPFPAVGLLLLTVVHVAAADEVLLANGSRLVGTIKQVSDGKIALATEFAGELVIDLAMVVSFASVEPLNVELASGDRVIGAAAVADEPGEITIASEIGSVTVETSKVKAVWPPGAISPEVAAAKAAAQKRIEALEPDWTIRLEAGAEMKEGNTDTLDARGRFDAIRKTEQDLLNFYLAAVYGEQDDTRNKNEYRGGVKYENEITEKWYWYSRAELEFDEFENLDLRATVAAGLGYKWFERPEHALKTRFGGGYRHETYDDGTTDDSAVIDLGLDYLLALREFAQFTHSATYSPDIEEFDNYRLYFDSALVFPLKDERWKLKLGMINEYNSRPNNDLERLDNTYYANILLEIKDE